MSLGRHCAPTARHTDSMVNHLRRFGNYDCYCRRLCEGYAYTSLRRRRTRDLRLQQFWYKMPVCRRNRRRIVTWHCDIFIAVR
jgi:hypothetical protein